MTNITELAQSLKAAAENATPGEWCSDDLYGIVADAGLNGNYYIASCSGPEHRSNKRFIALANPANILALVEALEKAQRYANLTEAERQAYLGLISKRDERIAELESRTVKMPEPFKLAKSSSGLTYYYADEVNEALSAAGIKWEAE